MIPGSTKSLSWSILGGLLQKKRSSNGVKSWRLARVFSFMVKVQVQVQARVQAQVQAQVQANSDLVTKTTRITTMSSCLALSKWHPLSDRILDRYLYMIHDTVRLSSLYTIHSSSTKNRVVAMAII